MISRDEQFERNGGGQFVAMNRVYKDKSKYNRKDSKREFRNNLDSFFIPQNNAPKFFFLNGNSIALQPDLIDD